MEPAHGQHLEMLDWVGGHFEPEYFDHKKIKFSDPKKRQRRILR